MQPIEHARPTDRTNFIQTPTAGQAMVLAQSERFTSAAWRDWLGVAASIACAVHCAAMPFVVGFLPLFGLSFFADPAFHQWMVAICLVLAVLAFVPGWCRHRRLGPLLVAVVGLSLISVAAFAGDQDCCPSSSEAGRLEVAGVATGEKAPKQLNTKQTAGCHATGCAGCSAPTRAPAQVDAKHASAMGSVWPWVTPLGGLLLVAAHLRNRYWSCRCGCAVDCESDLSLPVGHETPEIN